MVHVLTRSQVEVVSSVLGKEFAASPTSSVSRPSMYYLMKHSLEGKLWKGGIFAVDKWPDYTAIMGVDKMEGMGPSFLVFHWNDEEGLRTLLKDDNLFNWKKFFIVRSLPVNQLPIFEEAFKEKGAEITQTVRTFLVSYLHDTAPAAMSVAMDDVTVGPISPDHCQLVDETFEYGGFKGAQDLIRHQMATFISGCVTDKQGNPLSWVIRDQCGKSNLGFTLPEHRRKGYYYMAKRYYIEKCLEAGHAIFADVVEGNEASLNAQRKLGYVFDEKPNGAFLFVNQPKVDDNPPI